MTKVPESSVTIPNKYANDNDNSYCDYHNFSGKSDHDIETDDKSPESTKQGAQKNFPRSQKAIFITISACIIALFTLQSMLLIIKWSSEQFTCRKSQLDANFTQNVGSNYDRFFDILFISVEFLHVPEQIFLLYYLFEFVKEFKLNEGNQWNKNELWRKIKYFVQFKQSRCRAVLFTIVSLLFMLIAIATPSIEIWRSHTHKHTLLDEHCSSNVKLLTLFITYAIHWVSLLTSVIIALTCFLMIFFTIVIGAIWKRTKPADNGKGKVKPQDNSAGSGSPHNSENHNNAPPQDRSRRISSREVESGQNTSNACSLDADLKAVCEMHKESLDEYIAKTKKVKPIYKIFRSFFVFQWIIYIFSLSFHISKFVRPWIKYGQVANADNINDLMTIIHQVLFILFDSLALVITYTCALKMNAYLRRYIRKLQKEQLKVAEIRSLTLQYSLTHLFLIKAESVSKACFTPRIPGTGLNISINNPSFVLGIVFCVFGLIGAQITF